MLPKPHLRNPTASCDVAFETRNQKQGSYQQTSKTQFLVKKPCCSNEPSRQGPEISLFQTRFMFYSRYGRKKAIKERRTTCPIEKRCFPAMTSVAPASPRLVLQARFQVLPGALSLYPAQVPGAAFPGRNAAQRGAAAPRPSLPSEAPGTQAPARGGGGMAPQEP